MRPKTTTQRRSSNPLPSDILMTLGDLGVDVTRVVGGEAHALCPFHAERKPSWSINLDTGEHYCFSCGTGGNYLRLVEHVTRLEQDKAEEWIRKRGGIDVVRRKLRGEMAWEKKKPEEVSEADLFAFSPEVPLRELNKRDIIQEACEAYGVMWDPERKAWVLPIRDPHTNALMGWQIKGKDFVLNHPGEDDDHGGVEKARAVFGYRLLGDTAYVEESPLDCLRLWTYGVEGGVSGYGVHISDVQIDLILDRAKTTIFCLDNDRAGRKKEREIWETYRGRRGLYFANYTDIEAKDHGEMTPEEIEFSISNPISFLRYRP